MPRKTSLRRAAVVLFASSMAVLAGELVVRVVCNDKFGQRPGFYIADDVLGWKPASNLNHTFYGRDFTNRIATDAEGCRLGVCGKVDFHKRLVVLCGDSYVFGWGVSTGESMASYLDERVRDASSGNSGVVNLGVGSYGTWQNFLRLKTFMANHPRARIEAVFVSHAPNDGVDNVNSIGYHIGAWKVASREPKRRNPFHLINCLGYLYQKTKRTSEAPPKSTGDVDDIPPYLRDMIHPYLQDLLFAYATELPKQLPLSIVLNKRRISFKGISEEDWCSKTTFRRGNLTTLQRNLMLEGVNSIHTLLRGQRTKIIHMIVPTSPDWYVDEVMGVLGQTIPSADNDVRTLGRYPEQLSDFEGDVLNTHDAGHYSPEFNKYWADRIMRILSEDGIGN